MTLPIFKSTPEKAQAEIKRYSIVGIAFTIIPVFILGWLIVVGLAASGRTLMLSYHEGIKHERYAKMYRYSALALLVVGIVIAWVYLGSR